MSTVYIQRHADTPNQTRPESRPGAHDEAKENDMYDSHQGGDDEENKKGNSLLSVLVLVTELVLSSTTVDVFKLNSCPFPCC